jgi:hypothetical protein
MTKHSDDVETIECKHGVTIHIRLDPDPLNPRVDYDNVTKMICFHPRHVLGDKHEFKTPHDFLVDLTFELYDGAEDLQRDDLEEKTTAELTTMVEGKVFWLPLFIYDHSGITMSTRRVGQFTDRWDAGQVGWVYLTKKKLLEEIGNVPADPEGMTNRANEVLEADVETYDEYLTGQVYGYVIETPEDEHADSCWSFFGGIEYVRQEATSSAAFYEKKYGPGTYQVKVTRKACRTITLAIQAESWQAAQEHAKTQAAVDAVYGTGTDAGYETEINEVKREDEKE